MPAQSNVVRLRIDVDDQGTKVIQSVIDELQNLQAAVRKTTSTFRTMRSDAAALNRVLKQQARTEQDIAKQLESMRKEMSVLRRVSDSTKRSISGLSTTLGQTSSRLQGISRTARAGAGEMTDFASALNEVGGVLRALGDFGARQIIGFVQASSRLEDIRNAYTSIFMSTERANEAIQRLRTAALDPGLSFEVAARATQRFLALNLSLDEAIQVTRGFANAAVVTGISTASLEEGFRQLAKTISVNKVEQDDLQSIMERFLPLAGRIKTEFGATGKEVTDALRSAGLSVKDFAIELSDLNKQPRAAVDSLSVALSNLQNAWNNFQTGLGDFIRPIVTDVVNFLTEMLETFNNLPEPVKQTTLAIGLLGTAMTGLGTALVTGTGALAGLAFIFGVGTVGTGVGAAAGVAAGVGVTGGGGGLAAGISSATAALKIFGAAILGISKALATIVGPALAVGFALNKISEEARLIPESTGLGKIKVEVEDFIATVEVGVAQFESIQDSAIAAGIEVAAFGTIWRNAFRPDELEDFGRIWQRTLGQTFLSQNIQELGREALDPGPRPEFTPRNIQPLTIPRTQGAGFNEFFARPYRSHQEFLEYSRLNNRAVAEVEALNKRASAEFQKAWRNALRSVAAETRGTLSAFQVFTSDVLKTIGRAFQIGQRRTALQNRDITEEATRQFKALGDISALHVDNLGRLTNQQDQFTQALDRTRIAITETAVATESLNRLLEPFFTEPGGSESRISRAFGSFQRLLSFGGDVLNVLSFGNRLGSGELFHNPANDRRAMRAGEQAILAALPSARGSRRNRQQSATDFSQHFGEGVQNVLRSQGAGHGDGDVYVQSTLVLSEKTVQQFFQVARRMEQAGQIPPFSRGV